MHFSVSPSLPPKLSNPASEAPCHLHQSLSRGRQSPPRLPFLQQPILHLPKVAVARYSCDLEVHHLEQSAVIAIDAAELANGPHRKGADRAGSFWVAKEASSIAVATEVQEALCRMRPDPQEVTCRCTVRQSHWWVAGELAPAEHHKGDAGMAIIVALNAPSSSCRVVSVRDRHNVIFCRPTSPFSRATLPRSRWKLCICEFAKQTYQTMAMTAPVQLHSGCGLSARGFGSDAEQGGGLLSGWRGIVRRGLPRYPFAVALTPVGRPSRVVSFLHLSTIASHTAP